MDGSIDEVWKAISVFVCGVFLPGSIRMTGTKSWNTTAGNGGGCL